MYGANMTDLRGEVSKGGVSRHETFTPRYGWLKKGYDAAIGDGKVFIALEPCGGEGKKGLGTWKILKYRL